MAEFRERFPAQVMADLRGYFDEQGRSPFWEAIGKHFFDMDFSSQPTYLVPSTATSLSPI